MIRISVHHGLQHTDEALAERIQQQLKGLRKVTYTEMKT
jgi:hypothetical protein